MCLEKLTSEKPLIAKEDIVCYKALLGGMRSPYENYVYKLGRKETSELREIPGAMDRIISVGLHTFTSKEEAAREQIVWTSDNGTVMYHVSVFKCIIPKGAKYYKGVFHLRVTDAGSREAYASNELIVQKQVS